MKKNHLTAALTESDQHDTLCLDSCTRTPQMHAFECSLDVGRALASTRTTRAGQAQRKERHPMRVQDCSTLRPRTCALFCSDELLDVIDVARFVCASLTHRHARSNQGVGMFQCAVQDAPRQPCRSIVHSLFFCSCTAWFFFGARTRAPLVGTGPRHGEGRR